MSDKDLTLEDLAVQFRTLKAQNDDLLKQLAEKSAAFDTVLQVNADLSKKLEGFVQGSVTVDEKIQLPKLPSDPTFSYGKKKYRLKAPGAFIPGIGHRTADEIILDASAQKALVTMNSGIIKEVV